MDIILWILQIILSIKLLTTAFSHGLRQSAADMQEVMQKMGPLAKPVHRGVAVYVMLGTLGLLLPDVLAGAAWITPVTAVVMGLILLLSILFHVRTREKPQIFVSLVLFAFAIFIAIGRWELIN